VTGFLSTGANVMPEYPDRLVQALRDLSRLMVSEEGLDATLDRIATLACRVIPNCDIASLTVQRGGRPTTPVATDALAVEVDEAQYRADAGPCVDAMRERQTYRVDDTSEDQRWPAFSDAAAAAGVLSSMSLPMSVDDRGVGALNLYAKVPSAFSPADEDTGLLFAEQAAVAYLNADRYWSTYNITQQLEEALLSRDVIGQAKGVLMAQRRISADAAFDLLRQASQRRNIKLRDVAEDVALTGELPPT
jgi:GAF domain-containing protein